MNATARADAYGRQRGHDGPMTPRQRRRAEHKMHRAWRRADPAVHEEVAGWREDGGYVIECACGASYRGGTAEVLRVFAEHVATASASPRRT